MAVATSTPRSPSSAVDPNPRSGPLAHIELLGLPVVAATPGPALDAIRTAARAAPVRIAYVNAHTLNLARRDGALREALANSDFVLNDGAGVSLAARLQGRRFPSNLHGSDFNTSLLRLSAEEGWAVFLLGGRPGIAQHAATRLVARIPELKIVGARHGFHQDPRRDVQAVKDSGAQVLFVAMGNPRQELWLEACFRQLPRVRIGAGVGAYLDFQAGAIRRAPDWMNDCGIEWMFRLTQEPRRLAKRYLIGNPRFLLDLVCDRIQTPSAGREA